MLIRTARLIPQAFLQADRIVNPSDVSGEQPSQPLLGLERFVATGPEELCETWKPPTPDELEDIRGLAEANRGAFMAQVERLRGHLERIAREGTDP